MITTSREERCQMNLPNKLTVARVIAVPFFIALYMTGYFLPALILFCTILIAPIFISFRDSLYSFSNFTGSDKQYVGLTEGTTVDGTEVDEAGNDIESNYDKLFKKYLPDGKSKNPKYIGDALITAFILAALSTFMGILTLVLLINYYNGF